MLKKIFFATFSITLLRFLLYFCDFLVASVIFLSFTTTTKNLSVSVSPLQHLPPGCWYQPYSLWVVSRLFPADVLLPVTVALAAAAAGACFTSADADEPVEVRAGATGDVIGCRFCQLVPLLHDIVVHSCT